MKNILFILILLLICTVNLVAQKPLLKEIQRSASKLEWEIKRSDMILLEKDLSKIYDNYLFIPFLYLKNIEYTHDLMTSKEVGVTVMKALRKQPTVDNLRSSENFPHHAIFYDDSLRVSEDLVDYFSVFPPHADSLLKYYKSLNAQLLFYIWGLNDLFVLIDNRIYQLVYDEANNAYSKLEL